MENRVEKIYEWLSMGGFQFNNQSQLPLAISLIKEETEEMIKGINENNRDEILDGAVDSFWCICNALFFAGFKLEEVENKFEQVEKSNYSKFCKTREEAVESAELYIKGKHPTKLNQAIPASIKYSSSDAFPYVVVHADTGKLLKSFKFKHPNEF